MLRSLFGCLRAKEGGVEHHAGRHPVSRAAPHQASVDLRLVNPDIIKPDYQAEVVLAELQDLLGALPQGTWLSRASASLLAIARAVGAAEVRLYGVHGGSGDKSFSPRLFLLASEAADGGLAAGSLDPEARHDAGGAAPLLPGHEIWPANSGCGQYDGTEGTVPAGVGRLRSRVLSSGKQGLQQQQVQQDMARPDLPAMLDRMLGTKAPVTWSRPQQPPLVQLGGRAAPGGANAAGPAAVAAALLPLHTSCGLAGALWIVRHEPRPGVDPPASAPAARCPSLLASPAALRQLALSASLCLLGSEAAHVALLSGGLRQLAAAGSVQQLAGGLCEAVAGYAKQRFLLEPRVVAALVPEPDASMGLLLRRSEQDGLAVVGSPPATSKAYHRTASALSSGHDGLKGSAAQEMARAFAGVRNTSAAAVLTGKALAAETARVKSDSHPRRTLVPQIGGAAAATPAARPASHGTSSPRLALVLRDNPAASSGAVASGGSVTHVRAKPFPLAQTLIQALVRRAAAPPPHAACAAGGLRSGQRLPPGPGALGMEVADCTAHVQDARQASRDVLLLLMGAGAAPSERSLHGDRGRTGSGEGGGGMRSLVLLVLPVGPGRAMLGLYIMFKQQLPLRLLEEARAGMLEMLEVLWPLASRKLLQEQSAEFEALITAAPGSCTVVEAAMPGTCESPFLSASTANLKATSQPRDARGGAGGGSSPEATRARASGEQSLLTPAGGGQQPLLPHFLFDSRLTDGSRTGGGGGGGMSTAGNLMGSVADILGRCNSSDMLTTALDGPPNHLNHVELSSNGCATAGPAGPGGRRPTGGGMTSLLSSRCSISLGMAHGGGTAGVQGGSALYGRQATGWDMGSRSTSVIHLDELDPVHDTLRAQMPLIVASMQTSITSARVEAAVAAAAAAAAVASPRGAQPSGARGAVQPRPGEGSSDRSDLAQLELHSQLGQGGCAIVFKGSLGTLTCAVKLMEMPDVDGDGLTRRAGEQPSPPGKPDVGEQATQQGERQQEKLVEERRVMLQNAMELAAMTSLSHPNITQVFSTFSNVTLEKKLQADGTSRFLLRPIREADSQPGSPPACVAIVCEYCDLGCLGTALQTGSFPFTLPASKATKAAVHGSQYGSRDVQQPKLDYKSIYMTLLDIAMALRHLHSHNLIHRDLKPANVLLKANPGDSRDFTAKLADFGFVTLLNHPGDEASGGEPYTVVDEVCGTVTHMAPEALAKGSRLDAGSDVYSFGILMWELTARSARPFPDARASDIARLVQRGVRPTFDSTVPPAYRDRLWPGARGPRGAALRADTAGHRWRAGGGPA